MSTGERDAELSRLLQILEHDIKNPVGNILGYAALLSEDGAPLTAEQADVVKRIEQNCETILHVVQQFVAAHRSTTAR
jgi:signal transduction histidine kinase